MAGRRSGSRRGPEAPPPQPGDRDADPVAVARAIALRQLTAAPRSRAELERAMARKGVPEDAAAAVLDRFTELKLVDDGAYAEMLVRSRHTTRGLARRGLAHELRAKGIEDETATAALDQLDPEQELETARALVARRLPSTARLEPEARLRRLAGMLARKGYPQGLALRVVREALAAEGPREQDDALDDVEVPED
jgi:regulatory protein